MLFNLSNKIKHFFNNFKTTEHLVSVSWDIREDISKAQYWNKSPLDLSKVLFKKNISLMVSDRYAMRHAIIENPGHTVGEILQRIHEFYASAETKFEQTHNGPVDGPNLCETNMEKYGWCMGDGVFFSRTFLF